MREKCFNRINKPGEIKLIAAKKVCGVATTLFYAYFKNVDLKMVCVFTIRAGKIFLVADIIIENSET